MIRSMTGYGKATGYVGLQQITAEIRTLNSKQLDIGFRLPNGFHDYEQDLRSMLGTSLERGKVLFQVTVEATASEHAPELNTSMAKLWHERLHQLEKELNIQQTDNYLEILLKMPEVLQQESRKHTPEERNQFLAIVKECINQVNLFREQEGAGLKEEMAGRIEQIIPKLEKISPLEKERTLRIREKIQKSLADHADLLHGAVDQNRLEQEMIFYIEKLDITEEKVRLENHLRYFLDVLGAPGANGRKLGFIGQEIGREINTLGAKAQNFAIQQIVVEMKDELEKIKEQLFNVL